MKIRIRNKILITICALVLLSLVGQVVFNQFFSKEFFIYQQTRVIADSFEQIKTGYGDDLSDITEIADELQDSYGIKTVISDSGEIVYSSGHSSMLQGQRSKTDLMFQSAEFTNTPTVSLMEGSGVRGDTERLQLAGRFYDNGDEICVLMTLQIAAIENSVSVFTEANIYISLAVLLIGILIAILVSKNITKPITEIEAVSKKIATLDFSYIADENSSTIEIASLAQSINQMSWQLDKSMRELSHANEVLKKDIDYRKQIESMWREFIAGVSHEMKTPLALLQLYSENLKNDVDGIDKEYYCDTILEETDKLSTMVSEMLEISSIDNGFIQMKLETTDLSELCREIAQQYTILLSEFETEISIDDAVTVLGDSKYLERAIKNLLNNALQHTAKGERIRFTLRRNEKNGGDRCL